jgi:hypothetical protein
MGREEFMMRWLLLIVIVLGAALLSASNYYGYFPWDSPFVRSCEASLKNTLLAPATFRRLNLTEGKEALTFDQYYRANPSDSLQVQQFQRSMAKHLPARFIAIIEYDESNAFGTPIRGLSKCTYDDVAGDAYSATEHTVRIDGKTIGERLLDIAKAPTNRLR